MSIFEQARIRVEDKVHEFFYGNLSDKTDEPAPVYHQQYSTVTQPGPAYAPKAPRRGRRKSARQSRDEFFSARMQAAQTPKEKVAVAAGYAQAIGYAIAEHPGGGGAATLELARAIVKAAEDAEKRWLR